jgi:hypothetical protein
MRKALLFSILLVCGAPAAAMTDGKCDAVAFTLGKPAAKPAKPQPQVKPAAKPAAPVTKTAEAKPAPKAPLIAPCDNPKAKKKSG